MKNEETFKRGAAIRRQIVGGGYADEVVLKGGDLRNTFADMATKHLWGAYWVRPGLDMRSRSICTISLLITRGHGCEEALALHLRGALKNKFLTMEEIGELILHTSIYVGYPRAMAAMKLAEDIFSEETERTP